MKLGLALILRYLLTDLLRIQTKLALVRPGPKLHAVGSFYTIVSLTFVRELTFRISLFSRFHQQALVEVKILEHLSKKVSINVKYPYSGIKNHVKLKAVDNLFPF